MAYYFLFPESDTTMYSHPDRSEMNTGKDEILELVKERGSTDKKLYPSRILIKFKNEEIQSIITDSITPSVFNNGISKVNLQLTSTEPKNLTSTLNVVAYAVSQSWNEGTGRFLNLPTSSNGTTWNYRDNSIAKTKWTTSSFASTTTGSLMSASVLTPGGGVWYTGSGFYAPQQFLTGDNLDLDFDVTSIIQKHSASLFANSTYPTGIINNGFIIRKPDDVENHISTSFGDLQYFSVDTHTIYPPKLVFKWIDSVHNFQGESKQSGELNVSLYRNKKEFNQNDVATFRINVRDKYPTRTFTTSSNYLNAGYFTTSSFYSIRDAHTEQEVIPFDTTFTKLSADSEGMYFKIYMKGLQPERYYRLLFKHINNDGTMVYDNDYNFKVVR